MTTIAIIVWIAFVALIVMFFRASRIVSGPDDPTADDLAENAEWTPTERTQ